MWYSSYTYAEMRVRCCQKQDFRDGEDFQDGLVCGWRLLSESGIWGDFRVPDNRMALDGLWELSIIVPLAAFSRAVGSEDCDFSPGRRVKLTALSACRPSG